MSESRRLLLVFPAPIATIPPGLTFVAKRFRKNGFDVRIHINTFKKYLDANELVEQVIRPYRPDIVGLSFGTFDVLNVYKLQKRCKENGYFVIAGGNHPSIRPEEVLRHGADVVFRGEAELGIDAFCSWFFQEQRDKNLLDRVAGVSFVDKAGKVRHTPSPPRIQDLDSLGETDYSGINIDDFRVNDGSVKGLNVISCGRGCPFHCSYCSHRDWIRYTKRTPDSIVREMVNRHTAYGITTFWLSDETFVVDKNHVYEFCRRLKAEKLPLTWTMGTRISSVDEDLLRTMKDAGLKQITYGVESADDETLKRINKGYTAQKAYEVVTMTGRLGLPMYINLMTGFPWQTPASVENEIKFIKAVDRYVYCYQLYGAVIPYPDTEIYEEYHEQEGFTDFWIEEKYQNAGMVIYQNVLNPYKVSTFFQRNLYDDTYVAEDYFFRFTPEYKRAVQRMGLLIGWRSIRAQYRSVWRKYLKYSLGVGSLVLYRVNPNVEKQVIGSLVKVNRLHDSRLTGSFVRK